MPNAIFSWLNYADSGAFSAPVQASNLGVTNLVDPIVAKVWRALGTSSTYFDVQFSALSPIQLLGLVGADLSASDTIRHQLSAVAVGGSELYDSGLLSGLDPNYDQHFNVLSSPVNAMYWRCSINAASKAAQGYFDIGRAWAGPVFQPLRNYSYNNTEDFDDFSNVTMCQKSGAEYVDEGPQLRFREFNFSMIRGTDYTNIKEMLRYAGIRKQIVFIPDPSSATLQTEAILGRLRKTSAMAQAAFDVRAKSFTLYQSK